MDIFWTTIKEQLEELKSAKSADDVIRILSHERNPYGEKCGSAAGFFAGSGGDGTVRDSLIEAGWTVIRAKAPYYYSMRAPDGSVITYIEDDIYRGLN